MIPEPGSEEANVMESTELDLNWLVASESRVDPKAFSGSQKLLPSICSSHFICCRELAHITRGVVAGLSWCSSDVRSHPQCDRLAPPARA